MSKNTIQHRRPDGNLLTYYILLSLATGPFFPFTFLYRYFRYRTLRYEFDGEGITMRWGIIFRREISLTFARIQDIHLVSNVVERWLGLARIQIQTASASAAAEMTIEGLKDYDAIRDDLYTKMRGVRGASLPPPATASTDLAVSPTADATPAAAELAAALQEATAELRRLREKIAATAPAIAEGRGHAR